MTRKEWMELHHPLMVDLNAYGGVFGCPNSYSDLMRNDASIRSDVDYLNTSQYCANNPTARSCQSCWNQEMEVPKK